MPAGCDSEQAAAEKLGFTKTSWDNISGKEKRPSSGAKTFVQLTHEERLAAVTLGFTSTTWDNKSGKEKKPASDAKQWSELTTCGEEHIYRVYGCTMTPLCALISLVQPPRRDVVRDSWFGHHSHSA